MSRFRISLWSAIGAQAFAWAALVFLALWPYSYQGVSEIAVSVNRDLESTAVLQRAESPISFDQQSFNASLIEVNGPGVLLKLLVPVAITAIALSAVAIQSLNRGLRLGLLWSSAVLMLAFCALALFSFGPLYLPAPAALIAAAIAGIGRPEPREEHSMP